VTRFLAVLILLVLPALAQMPGVPPGPRVNGVLTTRIDPAQPRLTLSWDAGELPRVSGICWEIKLGPFGGEPHPITLSDEPLREGKFQGARGHGVIDVAGLADGEYYVRYIGMDGKRECTLASEAARFVIIAGNSPNLTRTGPTSTSTPTSTGPVVNAATQRLVPDSINLPLGSVQKFWPPEGATAVSWKVEGGGEIDQNGVYRPPQAIQGLTLPVRVIATLSDGKLAVADVMLLRPARFLGVEPSGIELKAGKQVQFRGQADGMTHSIPTWELVAGPGQLQPSGLYKAPEKLDAPAVVRVRMTWPGVAPQPVVVQITVVP
jgi:hypothetical protein